MPARNTRRLIDNPTIAGIIGAELRDLAEFVERAVEGQPRSHVTGPRVRLINQVAAEFEDIAAEQVA